jgi:hypothetical protein
MKHTGFFKAHEHDFSTQMNVTLNMNKFARKGIFIRGLQKCMVNALFKFSKLLEDVAGIIKIAERNEANGSQKNQAAYHNKVA